MFLAYDPARLDRLRRGIIDAALRLEHLHCAEPLAAETLSGARRVRDSLAFHWRVAIERILASTAMTSPSGGATTSAHGAVWLHTPSGATQPITSSTFGELVERLFEERVAAILANESLVASDAAFAELAALLGHHPDRKRLIAGIVTNSHPLAGALLLGNMAERLPEEQYGSLAALVFQRWRNDPQVDSSIGSGRQLSELLLPALTRSTLAARTFLEALSTDLGGWYVSARHTELAAAVVRAATDPANTTPAEAGRTLALLIDDLAANDDYHWAVATNDEMANPAIAVEAAAAPWLAWFGPRTDEFGWTATDGRRRVDVLAQHADAGPALMADLGRCIDQLVAALAEEAGGGPHPWGAVDDVAGTFALLHGTLRRAELSDAEHDRAMAAPIDALLGALPRLVSAPNPVVGAVARMVASRGVDVVRGRLVEWGALPPDETTSQGRADQAWSGGTVDAGVVLFTLVAQAMIDDGDLPVAAAADLAVLRRGRPDGTGTDHATDSDNDECTADAARRRMGEFIEQWSTGVTAERLAAVRNAVLNPPTTEVACR